MSEVKDVITGSKMYNVEDGAVYNAITGRKTGVIENGVLKSAISGANVAFVGSGGGGSAKYYKCASVDIANKTWSGYGTTIDESGYVTFADEVTDGLTYTLFTPKAGEVWSENAMLQIGKFLTPIAYPTDIAFNLPLDATSNSGEDVTLDSCGVGGWCPRENYLEHSKNIDGVKCLYLHEGSKVYIEVGGGLFAKNDTTANEVTGCSARYGVGHPWTYSFWFYPNSQTNVGEGLLFTLGYCYNSGYDRRLRLAYNDVTGTFQLQTDRNDSATTEWSGYAEKQKWHHICVTGKEDSKTFALYIDGVYVVTLTHGSNIPYQPYTNPDFWLGGTASNPGGNSTDLQHVIGGYAKMKWYNRILEPGEIVALSQEITPTGV